MTKEKTSKTTPWDETLRLLPGPVTVLGVASAGKLFGLTAAWVTRVSHEPPLIMVSVGHERQTWQAMNEASHFSLSLLADGQVPEARLFGLHSGRDRDKWAEVDHILLGDQTPVLAQCSAHFLCQVVDRVRTGDHDCFIGEIKIAETLAGSPVLPLRGRDYVPTD